LVTQHFQIPIYFIRIKNLFQQGTIPPRRCEDVPAAVAAICVMGNTDNPGERGVAYLDFTEWGENRP